MNCPKQLFDILLEIIRIGVLRIRSAVWRGDSALCVIEADHIHNLPLLKDFNGELLLHYWEVEKPCYLLLPTDEIVHFLYCWNQLADFLE